MELELASEKRLEDDLLHVIVEGLIGEGAALEFMAFLQWSGKIPDVGKMLAGEIKPTIPKRPDQRMLCCRLLFTTCVNMRGLRNY